jgi:hypothetical protein
MELLISDRRRRRSDPGGEQLQEATQALVVEQGRGLDHACGRVAMTRFQHLGERVREVVRQRAHRLECKRPN